MLNKKMFRDIKKNLSQFITIFLMVTIGIMVYATMLSYSGAMQKSGDKYYSEYNLFDLEAFGEKFTKDDLENIKKLDNIKDAERKLTVRGISKDNTLEINFIESNNIIDAGDYIRYINEKDEFIKLDSNEGVYLTRLLAQKNNIKVGDKIKWHINGKDEFYESTVIGLNKDPQIQNMTMTKEYYESLGLEYKANYLYTNDSLSESDTIEGVEFIQGNESLRENLDNMMSMVTDLIVIIVFLAVVLGAVIIYNMGVLSYGEKEYQFATLKVLGFENKKIKKIFTKQNIWVSIIAAILGMPCGYYITNYVFKMVADRDYDFGAIITVNTYIISFVVTVICAYLVSIFIARKIKNIDMVTSLKGNE